MKYIIKKQINRMWNYYRFRKITTRYLFDKPRTLYHPLPWMGLMEAKRGNGSPIRLNYVINKISHIKGSVFDFGSAEGYFSISLAEKGFHVLGLEASKSRYDISKLVAEILDIKNVSFLNIKVDEKILINFPSFDYTICFAVWHHWVRYFGFNSAEKMLKILWDKTTKFMFFETGLEELPDEYGMPKIEGNNDEWLINYLKKTLPNSKVIILGQAPAFPPEQFKSNKTKYDDESFLRNIYCIEKSNI